MRSLLIIFCACCAVDALARDYQRAELYSYAVGPTEAPPITGGGGRALAPLPVNFLAGMVVLEAGGRVEGSAEQPYAHTQFGLTYFQHVAEGVPHFRVSAHRYGDGHEEALRPIVESAAVLQGNDADLRWLRLVPGFRTRVGVGARAVHVPDVEIRAEPIVELSLERQRRWLIEMHAPRSLELRYTGGSERQWAGYAKAESLSFYATGPGTPWLIKPERRASIGGRWRLGGSWFASLATGVREQEAQRAPYAELALQNWKSMP